MEDSYLIIKIAISSPIFICSDIYLLSVVNGFIVDQNKYAQEICSLTLICEYPFIYKEMTNIYYCEKRGAHKIKSVCINRS